MIVLESLIVLLRGLPCFPGFLHGASLHPHSMIFALVIVCLHVLHIQCRCIWLYKIRGIQKVESFNIDTQTDYIIILIYLYNSNNNIFV